MANLIINIINLEAEIYDHYIASLLLFEHDCLPSDVNKFFNHSTSNGPGQANLLVYGSG